MILRSEDKHLSLDESGRLFWQDDPTNPLPGAEIGQLAKGEGVLHPKIVCEADAETTEKLQNLVNLTLRFALKPLFDLVEGEDLTATAEPICRALYEALGVLPRDAVQSEIDALDEEGRAALRKRKIRMGPLLIFLPDLNKPAAVKLKALLLTLWNDKPLPAEVPNDGIVSYAVNGQDLDTDYYRTIGYPVYGPRVIRVDMLDRVVCAVYDASKDGRFQAQHQMAEWLGSNIEDLYAVLEAMGHKRISESGDQISEVSEEKPQEEATEQETPDSKTQEKPQEKPELATFYLKRGSAISKPKPKSKPKATSSADKPKFKKSKKPAKKQPRGEKVFTAEAKQEDSPFAILSQLKK